MWAARRCARERSRRERRTRGRQTKTTVFGVLASPQAVSRAFREGQPREANGAERPGRSAERGAGGKKREGVLRKRPRGWAPPRSRVADPHARTKTMTATRNRMRRTRSVWTALTAHAPEVSGTACGWPPLLISSRCAVCGRKARNHRCTVTRVRRTQSRPRHQR